MTMKKKYQSEQLMAIHQSAQDLFELGIIDRAKMREFDEDCLVPEPLPKVTPTANRSQPSPATASPGRAG
jgi:DNA-binding transcriptional regulator YiaG